MNLYNPTNDVIEDRYSGIVYMVDPDEIKSLPDDIGKHMVRRNRKSGLVSLDYGIKEEKDYGSISNMKETKKTEGLQAYRDWIQVCFNQESVFPREVKQKNGGEVELSSTRIPYFKAKLKEIDDLIKQSLKKESKKSKAAA